MSDSSSTQSNPNPPEILRPSRRDYWASICAGFFTLIHLCIMLFVAGWYYWIVPRFKFQIDTFGVMPSKSAILLIQQSDAIVNYWYLLAVMGIPLLIFDFAILRWMTKQLGPTMTLLFGFCIATLIFMNFAVGDHIFSDEIARLQDCRN